MWIEINGYKIYAEIFGTGKPMICLHGLNSSHEMFHNNNFEHYFQGYQYIAVDLPGYGCSDFIPDLTFETMEAVISKILDKVGIYKISLCGYCLGGIFCLDYAIRETGRIESLHLIETMIYYPFWLDMWRWNIFGKAYNLACKSGLIKIMEIMPYYRYISDPKCSKVVKRTWDISVNSYYLELMKNYKMDHIKRSKAIACPVEMICGKCTLSNVKKTYCDLKAVLKNSMMIRLNEKGHFAFWVMDSCYGNGGMEKWSIIKKAG